MTYTGPWSADYIDAQYKKWQQDPEAVEKDWQFFFRGFELGLAGKSGKEDTDAGEPCDMEAVRKQSKVEALVYRYRDIGHLLSCLDPLEACPTEHPLLEPKAFGLGDDDMDRRFYVPGLPETRDAGMSLRELIDHLRQTYCRSVGVEYMHMQDPDERRWLRERMESTRNRPTLTNGEKIRIFRKLTESSRFEGFIHRQYLGQKRFSGEGADVIIPMLDTLFSHAAQTHGCEQIVLGMAHRGRLNVQTNVLNKPYADVIREFEDQYNPEAEIGAGDVKYHKGYRGQIATAAGGSIDVIMAHNPSHLESVNPVVGGMARARQDVIGRDVKNRDVKNRENTRSVMPLLIHGDAAFSGQGVTAETLNMSQLDGFFTGGTVHIIINNQIGYTALPADLRSTRYATDVAKSLMIPIFHVHGENPEAAVHTVKLACDYRMAFGKDVVIDVVCYRRYGHNEGDEPYFTQPLMVERIKNRPPVDQLYAQQLTEEEAVADGDIKAIREETGQCIQDAYDGVKKEKPAPQKKTPGRREAPRKVKNDVLVNTRVKSGFLEDLAARLS
ncbi:MAG: thiamine pyrophosphate-dependent enzyme, partial [Desulfosalsimonadaceae bacterium]